MQNIRLSLLASAAIALFAAPLQAQSLFDLYEAYAITHEDALRNADSLNDLRLQIKLKSQRARNPDLASGTEHMKML